jgi:hypothetical protein
MFEIFVSLGLFDIVDFEMLSYFPTPYNDELLASLVARHHKHVGTEVVRTANVDPYGMRHQRTSLYMPTNITGLHQNVSQFVAMSRTEMVDNLTNFPYDFAHSTADLRQRVRAGMLRPGVGRGSTVARFQKRAIGIKLCVDCQLENTKRYGEPYWHRSHNVDGAHYCWLHGVELRLGETQYFVDDYRPLEALAISTPSSAYLPTHSEKTRQLLIEFARRARTYLDGSVRKKLAYNYETLGRDFFCRIYPFAKGSRRIDMESMGRDFIRFFGEQFLDIMNLPVAIKCKGNWFRSMFVAPSHLHRRETRKHIVMSMFIDDFLVPRGRLFPKSRQFLESNPQGPWLCQNPAADHFGEAVLQKIGRRRTVSGWASIFACSCGFEFSAKEHSWDNEGQPVRVRIRYLGQALVDRCKELASNGLPKSQIAKILRLNIRMVSHVASNEGLGEKWISVSPHAFSEQKSGSTNRLQGKRASRFDHASRDASYAQKVKLAASVLKDQLEGAPSKSRVLKTAGIGNFIVRDLRGQYPLTIRAIDEVAKEFEVEKRKIAA